jgi:hypothetical protein
VRKRLMGLLMGVLGLLLAACGGGGGGGPDPAAAGAAETRAALEALPQLEVTVTGGVDMRVRAISAGLGCTGPNGIVRNAFVIAEENLTIYIPVSAEPGELSVVGRNEPGAADPANVVFEYLPTSSLFFGRGGGGTFTLESLPSRVGEFAMGTFQATLSNSDGSEITLDGRFRIPASLRTFDLCRDQLVETPVPTNTPPPPSE